MYNNYIRCDYVEDIFTWEYLTKFYHYNILYILFVVCNLEHGSIKHTKPVR